MIEWLRGYTITLCTAVFFITVVELILPDNGMKKYARFVMGLILITVIINPIIKLYNKNFNFDSYVNAATKYIDEKKYQENYSQYKDDDKDQTIKVFEENMQNACKNTLQDKFQSNNFNVNVSASYDEQGTIVKIDKIQVLVSSGKVEKVEKIIIKKGNSKEQPNVELDNVLGKSIKEYLSTQLNIPESNINVYKK